MWAKAAAEGQWKFQMTTFTFECVPGLSPVCAFKCLLKSPAWIYVGCIVASPREYFDITGPWRKVLADLKKSLYTLQADPEKSRDFMLKNPGILIDWKSRDPGIPLGPADDSLGRFEVMLPHISQMNPIFPPSLIIFFKEGHTKQLLGNTTTSSILIVAKESHESSTHSV